MKLIRLLPLLGVALVAASSAHAQAPRPALFAEFDETAPADAARRAPAPTGLQLAMLQSAGGLQTSAGLGQRGALPARSARTDDDEWRRLFPKKAPKTQTP
jgi:hypothetical protein